MSTLTWHCAHERRSLGYTLCGFLPKKAKRIVVLASLYRYITSDTFEHTYRLERLNRQLNLCEDNKALRFPSLLSQSLWGEEKPMDFNIPSTRGPMYRLACAIVADIRPPLRYSCQLQMVVDVLQVLRASL